MSDKTFAPLIDSRPVPVFVDGGQGRLGDRLASFSVCLPAAPSGQVAVIATKTIATALLLRFPHAVVLGLDSAAPIPEPGSVGLLLIDLRLPNADQLLDAITPLLIDDAVVATIDKRGEFAIYPNLEFPELIRRRGWPLPTVPGVRTQLRRQAGVVTAGRRGVPFLGFVGPEFESLADCVSADVGATLGVALRLVGIHAAGRTILRLTGTAGDDVAVRLWLSETPDDAEMPGLRPDPRIIETVPGVDGFLPVELARGISQGHRWVATRWVSSGRVPLFGAWRSSRVGARVVGELSDALGAVPTGSTFTGWSAAWLSQTDLVPRYAVEPFLHVLSRLDNGLPTGWCHGDLWPGNVLVEGSHATIIDWANSADDAPLGIDRLLIEALRLEQFERLTMAQACEFLVDSTDFTFAVAGQPWNVWDRDTRAALALAAYLLYLRNHSIHELGTVLLEEHMASLLAFVRGLERTEGGPEHPAHSTGETVKGAGWLGLGAGVVKASQTAVLLILAALLAPSAMGILAIGALVLNVTSAVTDLGSSTALVYWRGDAERAARSALTLAVGLALLLTGGAWLIAPWLSAVLNAGDLGTGVIRGLMLCLPLYSVSGVSQELLRRDLAFKRRVLPDIAGALLGTMVSIVLAFAGHGVYSLVIGQLVQATCVLVLCWAMRPPVRPGWHARDAVGLVSYGGHLAGANILQLLMLNVDYIIVARILGTKSLGVYSMAFRLAYMPYLLVAVVICGAAFPHLCRLRDREVGRAVSEVVVNLMSLVLPLYLGMILLAPQFELLGVKWAPGVSGLRWLAAYGLVLSAVSVCLVALNSVSHTRDSMLLNLLHLILLTSLLLWLTNGGVMMVAVAQLVAGLGMLAMAIAMLRRRVTGLEWRRHFPAFGAMAVGAVCMTVTGLSVQYLFPWTRVSVPGLLLTGTLILTAYVVPVLLLRDDGLGAVSALAGRKS